MGAVLEPARKVSLHSKNGMIGCMRTLSSCLLVATACLVAGGCFGRDEVTVPFGHNIGRELSDVRSGATHTVYYLGRRFEGLPLTAVAFDSRRPGVVGFMYGTCTIPLPADGGCGVPVEIQLFPFRTDQWSRAVGCTGRATLRGVPTVRQDGLVLFTRDTIIKIYAGSAAQTRRAVRALRPLDSPPTSARLLPTPPRWQVNLVESVCLVTPRGGLRRP
jgi:hypothetical protein